MSKIDYKKDYKELYVPKAAPALIEIPNMNFIMIDGEGDPNLEEYSLAVEMLYSLSYTIKMKGKDFANYCEYTVFPLEGLWWTNGGAFSFDKRDNWLWTAMIRQPDFVTDDVFKWALDMTSRKKANLDMKKARFESFCEGLCVQIMHFGPYKDEPASVEKMNDFLRQNQLIDATGNTRKHHEIYLSDPTKVTPEKMKTVLRHPVEKP